MARKRGRGPAQDNACGTYRGYYRHWRRHEDACRPCLNAMNLHQEDQRLAPQRRAILDAEVAIFEKRHKKGRAA